MATGRVASGQSEAVMTRKPSGAVRVAILPQTVAFYTERLGFRLLERDEAGDRAVLDGYGYPLLFAGPAAGDLSAHLAHPARIVARGAVLHYSGDASGETPAGLAAKLARAGLDPDHHETWYGSITVAVPDPDGYTVSFWFSPQLTRGQVRELYALGLDALDDALFGLPEAHLDLARAPGKWTIRQIVHHLVDSEATALARAIFALAEPDRFLHPNLYDPDHWAESLDYAGRGTGPGLALFRAVREHMLQLVDHLPGAWERGWVGPAGPGPHVGKSLEMLAIHAFGHIDQILETRRVHGL
jgi:catechol 2,3-dioxygenase-like lactoylglutathione lyase family enzyme